MKKVLLLLFVAAIFSTLKAQNVQLHYDFGVDRKLVTTTVEMFRPDKYGSTFFFLDMDYSSDARGVNNGLSLAYWEFARAFKWNENQIIQPRVEYNGGTLILNGEIGENQMVVPIENCLVAGIEHTFASSDFSRIFTLQANYKYIHKKMDASFQLTAVWVMQFLDNKLTFNGFADFWKEDFTWFLPQDQVATTKYRFLTEPQLWYNPISHLSIGTELELSNNFETNAFRVNPTIGIKVTF